MSLYHRIQWVRFHLSEWVKIYNCQYWQGKWLFMDIFTASQLWVNALTILDFILRMNGLEQSIVFVKNIECHKSNTFYILIAVFWKKKKWLYFSTSYLKFRTHDLLYCQNGPTTFPGQLLIYTTGYIYINMCLCVILRHRKVSYSHCVIRRTIESASHHY